MLRGFRIVAIGTVIAATVSGLLLAQAGAGPTAVDPGEEEAAKVLDCPPGEGVFSYYVTWIAGSEFDTPRAALDGILKSLTSLDFDVSTTDFVAKDVVVDSQAATQFTSVGEHPVVIWATPFRKGWLADGMYGCTKTVE